MTKFTRFSGGRIMTHQQVSWYLISFFKAWERNLFFRPRIYGNFVMYRRFRPGRTHVRS